MGTFEAIYGGFAREAIRFLTGAPTVMYVKAWPISNSLSWSNSTFSWDKISNSDSEKFIMLAYTPGTTDSARLENGLAANHAYSLIAAYVVRNEDGSEKAKLYLIRNPWGSDGNFNGSWCDSDPIWEMKNNTFAA